MIALSGSLSHHGIAIPITSPSYTSGGSRT
jgi:hypothetical protein